MERTLARGSLIRRSRNVWIVSPWIDLVFFIATPILILPALFLAEWRFSLAQISLFVASFGALGHHLPGMMRAYGDRPLFNRFKYRFLFAPLLIATTCVLFAIRELNGIVLIAYLWGVWHALMQTYGFLRIYEAKSGTDTKLTAQLDRSMCLAWFVLAVVRSPSRMFKIFSDYYSTGAAALPPQAISSFVSLWTIATVVVTLVFVGNLVNRWLQGQGISPTKLLLIASSFSFWWYTNAIVPNMLIGVALFEVFHDVQYLAIVWLFNTNRAQSSQNVGRFTMFLFRRSWAFIGLYIGLIVGYGWLNFVPLTVSSDLLRRGLRGVIVGSALLHFYYDSFIWKVRERDTGESLGVAVRRVENNPVRRVQSQWLHLAWVPLFGVAAWLSAPPTTTRTELETSLLIASVAPGSDEAHNKLAISFLKDNRAEDGLLHLREAVRLNPLNAEAHSNLGLVLSRRGDVENARAEYDEALRLDPSLTQAYSNLGNLLVQQGRLEEAIPLYLQALRVDPEDPQARTNLAGVLLRQGRIADAIEHLQRVLKTQPSFEPAQQNLQIARAARFGG